MLATLDVKLVFPARAGMSLSQLVNCCFTPRVPRASGDEPASARRSVLRAVCSPRERG